MALYRFNSTNNQLTPITSEGNSGIPVGAISAFYGPANDNWLLCDGRDTTGTAEELRLYYPALYTYLGSNTLPDLRECTLVGAGTNDTDTIADHDVYNVGEFKDDQIQEHQHYYSRQPNMNRTANNGDQTYSGNPYNAATTSGALSGRTGTTTHGKQKGVNYYIKATSAGLDVDPDLYATKGYIRDQNVLSSEEIITLGTTAATATTMSYDGFITLNMGWNNNATGYTDLNGLGYNLNNVYHYIRLNSYSSYAGSLIEVTIPVNKGDKLWIRNAEWTVTSYSRFYKLRDYSDRT